MKKLLVTASVLSTILFSFPSLSSTITTSSPHKIKNITIINTAKNKNNFTQVKSVTVLSGADACKKDVNAKGKFCFPIHNANTDTTLNFLDNETFIFTNDIPPNGTGGLLITPAKASDAIENYNFNVMSQVKQKDGSTTGSTIFSGNVKNMVGITCDLTSCKPWTNK